MSYGAIMGKKGKKGMTPQIVVTPTVTFTSVTATSPSGVIYTGVFANGVWTISVKEFGEYTVNAQGDSPATATVDVVVCKQYEISMGIDSVLNNNSWALISQVAQAGNGASYWSVGDSKQIVLNGTVYNSSTPIVKYSNSIYLCFILGFNHNATYEGNNKIHFCIGKNTQNVQVSLTDYHYNTDHGSGYRMRNISSNSGGWSSSVARAQIVPSFLNILEQDLKSVIVNVTKYTDNVGGGDGSVLSNVTSTSDTLFLFSPKEVTNSVRRANSYEGNYQMQYEYFANGNSPIFYRDNRVTNESSYLMRSPESSTDYRYCIWDSRGYVYIQGADYCSGFLPCFCV